MDLYDEQRAFDFAAVRDMIEKAQRDGLLIEVVMAFGEECSTGSTLTEAACYALDEWDCG